MVASGVVYIGSFDHNVYALDANTDESVELYDRNLVASSPAAVNRIIYVGRIPVMHKVMLNPTMMITVAHAM